MIWQDLVSVALFKRSCEKRKQNFYFNRKKREKEKKDKTKTGKKEYKTGHAELYYPDDFRTIFPHELSAPIMRPITKI